MVTAFQGSTNCTAVKAVPMTPSVRACRPGRQHSEQLDAGATMTRSARDWVLLAGNSNRPLAQAVSRALGTPLGACDVERFPDGEISVRLLEPVHRKDVYVLATPARTNGLAAVNASPRAWSHI